MSEQLTLADDMREDPPACYDEAVEIMLNGLENAPEIAVWSPERLACEMLCEATWDQEPTVEDIAKCIRIWRERDIANG